MIPLNQHLSEDDLALFALALLSPEEAAAAQAHVRNCTQCRNEVAGMQGDLVAYAFSAEMQDPPAAARSRFIAAVAAEPREASTTKVTPVTEPFAPGGTLLNMPSLAERSSRRGLGPAGWAGWAVAAGLAAFAGWEFTQTEHAHQQLTAQNEQLTTQGTRLAAQSGQLQNQNAQLEARNGQLSEEGAKIAAQTGQLTSQNAKLAAKNGQVANQTEKLTAQSAQLSDQGSQLAVLKTQLASQTAQLAAQQTQLSSVNSQLTAKDAELATQTAHAEQVAANAAHAERVLHALTDPAAMQVALHLTAAGANNPPKPEGHASYNAATGALVFVGTHLEQIKADKTYELWVLPASGAAPVAAGTFRPDSNGNASVLLPNIPKGVAAKGFGITVEDAGGSTSPTLPILLAGT